VETLAAILSRLVSCRQAGAKDATVRLIYYGGVLAMNGTTVTAAKVEPDEKGSAAAAVRPSAH
jgi:hypothetical protein